MPWPPAALAGHPGTLAAPPPTPSHCCWT